jgi:DNA-binding MarR family transcriptional regulator
MEDGGDGPVPEDVPGVVPGLVLSHGANVLRAVARNLDSAAGAEPGEPPLDHPTARDAVTMLGWHGPCTSEKLQEALDLSQPACVRVVDRLEAAGLVTRGRVAGGRRLHIALTGAGERLAEALVREARREVERVLARALPGPGELERFVEDLDRVSAVLFGGATDTVRFCRSCDARACLDGPRGCPSENACLANLSGARLGGSDA